MFARKVSMHLKANGAQEFKQKVESEVIPLLRKQAGFLDEITFLYPSGKEVHAFSLWESAEHAEAYNRATYPQVTKILASVVEGAARVQTYEVLNSTIQRASAAVAA
jgi:heme-degrading monooxygenase HmoA